MVPYKVHGLMVLYWGLGWGGGKTEWGQGIPSTYWEEIEFDHSKLGSPAALLLETMPGTGNPMMWVVAKDSDS